MCAKASLSLQHHLLHSSAITSFSQPLKRDTDMVVSYYHVVPYLRRFCASLEQCSTRLLKMLHEGCNTDVLGGFTDISSALSLRHCTPSGLCAYISQTPCCCVTYLIANKSGAIHEYCGCSVNKINVLRNDNVHIQCS